MLALQSFVEQGATNQIFFKGGQIYCSVWGEVVCDVAVGEAAPGVEMCNDTLMRVYCTGKPILALGIARLVEDGVMDLDTPVASYLPWLSDHWVGRVSGRQLLAHRAGLERIANHSWYVPTREEVRELILKAVPPEARLSASLRQAYSESGAWSVLGLVVEAITDSPVSRFLRDEILQRVDATETWLGMSHEEWETLAPRMGVNYQIDRDVVPLLSERLASNCCGFAPNSNTWSNMRSLGRVYERLLRIVVDKPERIEPVAEATLATFLVPQAEPEYDPMMRRVCQYGLGFMVNLPMHRFGKLCSDSSFGHSGAEGSSFAFCDPRHGLVVAFAVNGIGAGELAVESRRPHLIESVYRDLDLDGSAERSGAEAGRAHSEYQDEQTPRAGFLRRGWGTRSARQVFDGPSGR